MKERLGPKIQRLALVGLLVIAGCAQAKKAPWVYDMNQAVAEWCETHPEETYNRAHLVNDGEAVLINETTFIFNPDGSYSIEGLYTGKHSRYDVGPNTKVLIYYGGKDHHPTENIKEARQPVTSYFAVIEPCKSEELPFDKNPAQKLPLNGAGKAVNLHRLPLAV